MRWSILWAFGIFIAWRIFSLAAAEHWAISAPQRALSWRPAHPDALLHAAEGKFKQSAWEQARALARHAVAANPLDGRGYRMLGLDAARRGDDAQAIALLEIASTRTPRDRPTHVKLVEYYLKRQQIARIWKHLDLMLKAEPDLAVLLHPPMLMLADIPATVDSVLQVLATGPHWRTAFLRQLALDGGDLQSLSKVFEGLKTAAAALTQVEHGYWLERLIREQQWDLAYASWVGFLPEDRRAVVGNVYDGGFEFTPAGGGFDWYLIPAAGARIDQLHTAGGEGGRSLRVAFENRRVAFRHIRQVLVLPAGDYRLQGRVKLDGLRSERGLAWVIRCAQNGQRPLAITPAFQGSGPWRPFVTDFTVSADRCRAQSLSLESQARIPAEQWIGGVVWFDALSIRRLARRRFPGG